MYNAFSTCLLLNLAHFFKTDSRYK